MNKKAFTLVELLAVIVILAIVLAIAIPRISSIIESAERSSFVSSTKLLIKAVQTKLLEDENFDITTINKSNMKTLLNIDDNNYASVSFIYDDNDKVYITLIGADNWDGFVTCGTYENINITECIVTTGLLLRLDAVKKTSYPGSGNTWYDLSGNGNNGTLLNDVVYDISSGSFVFDGVNNNVSLISTFFNNSITDSLSIESWVKASSLSYTVIGGGQDTVGTRYTASLNANVLSSKEFGFDLEAVNGQVRLNSSPNSLKLNVWNHLVGTYNGSEAKFYLNGLLVDTDKRTSGNIVDFDEIILGKDISGGRYFNGNVSTYSIYNKELTSQEIKQNFNALRERYGL